MNSVPHILSRRAEQFGYAGLLPPVVGLCVFAADPETRWIVRAAGFGYSAFIFAFIGGIWWGLAMTRRAAPLWIWITAVMPSLIALALYLPWTFGWPWPRPSMLILSALILFSPLVDRSMASSEPLPAGWLRVRIRLSAALSLLTLLLSLL